MRFCLSEGILYYGDYVLMCLFCFTIGNTIDIDKTTSAPTPKPVTGGPSGPPSKNHGNHSKGNTNARNALILTFSIVLVLII